MSATQNLSMTPAIRLHPVIQPARPLHDAPIADRVAGPDVVQPGSPTTFFEHLRDFSTQPDAFSFRVGRHHDELQFASDHWR